MVGCVGGLDEIRANLTQIFWNLNLADGEIGGEDGTMDKMLDSYSLRLHFNSWRSYFQAWRNRASYPFV